MEVRGTSLAKLSHGTTAKDLMRVIHNELALGLYDLAPAFVQLSIKSNADDVLFVFWNITIKLVSLMNLRT